MIELRQSGRTTEQLRTVLELCAGPQVVYYVWPVRDSLSYPMDLLGFLADERFLADEHGYDTTYRYANHTVYFTETGAEVRFVTPGYDPHRLFMGKRNFSVVLDHDVYARSGYRSEYFTNVRNPQCTNWVSFMARLEAYPMQAFAMHTVKSDTEGIQP